MCGLPSEGEVSSQDCGAMPFRTEPTGRCAKRCIRGEDWAWFNLWASTRYSMPKYSYYGSQIVHEPFVWKNPRLQQLKNAYEYTTSAWTRFGQYYYLPDQEVNWDNGTYKDVVRSGLKNEKQMKQHIPDELNGDWDMSANVSVPLKQEYVQNIFDDLSCLKCTIGDMSFNRTQGHLYQYEQRTPTSTPTKSVGILSGLYHWDGMYGQNRCIIGMEIEPYIIARMTHSDLGEYMSDWKYMIIKCGSKEWAENSEQQKSRFPIPTVVNGETIAQIMASHFGVSTTPAATQNKRGRVWIDVNEMYAAVYPDYMQLY